MFVYVNDKSKFVFNCINLVRDVFGCVLVFYFIILKEIGVSRLYKKVKKWCF